MFDLRRPIKIFVANGEVRYGPRVDDGFFPVFSVELIEEAKLLTEIVPWACTDSLTSYSSRLEKMSKKTLTEKYEAARELGLPNSGDLARDAKEKERSNVVELRRAIENGLRNPHVNVLRDGTTTCEVNPIAEAIMSANEDE